MNNPSLSIIVPVYNTEKYLDQCIESILNSTYTDFELITINDGSTDNSLEVLKKWQKKDSRIVILEQENVGLVGAIKSGIHRSLGKYLAFVDSDDYIFEKDMYERMMSVVLKHDVDIVHTGFLRELKNGDLKPENINYQNRLYIEDELVSEIFPKMIYNKNTHERGILPTRVVKLVKKELVLSVVDYYNEKLTIGEDMVLVYSCMLKAKNSYFIPNYYPYFYRKNPNSMVNTFSEIKYKKIEFLYECLSRLNEISPIDLQKQIDTDFIQQYLELLDVQMLATEKRAAFQGMKRIIENEQFINATKNCYYDTMTKKHKIYLFLLKYRLFGVLFYIRKLKKV